MPGRMLSSDTLASSLCLICCLEPLSLVAEEPGRGVAVVASASQLPHAEENWLVAAGINRFDDETVSALRYCVNDARAVHGFFTGSGLVSRDRAYLLITDAAESRDRPTRNNILETVQYVARHAGKDSTILLHFSAHGFVDPEGRSYILPEDGKTALLQDTGVAVARINEMLGSSACKRKVVFVDACRNNPYKEGKGTERKGTGASVDAEVFLEALKSAQGQVTLAACGRGQTSYEDDKSRHGVFTQYLIQGLQGGAQVDDRGLINVSSLQAYLAKMVPDWTRSSRRPEQNPWMWGEMSAPIPLAVKGQVVPPVPPLVAGGGAAPSTQPEAQKSRVDVPAPAARSETAAWEALGRLEGFTSGKPFERQVAMYESYVEEWNGTKAASDAAKTLGKLKAEGPKRAEFTNLLQKARSAVASSDWQAATKALADAGKIYPDDQELMATRNACPYVKWSSDGRFLVSREGVILDTRKSLEWIVGPDRDTTRSAAVSWVNSCTVGGGRWRMPTKEELGELYQKGKGERNLDPVFETTAYCVWAEGKESADSPMAWGFGFKGIYEGSGTTFNAELDLVASGFRFRVFGVRASRK